MIRVLHSVSNMDRGGIETMLMNYYRNIDRNEIQFDFICNKIKPGDYDEEIKALGGRIFHSPGLSPLKYPKYLKFMSDILKENPDIKILHAHNEGMMFYPLSGAKKAGLGVRIAHAHNTKIIKDYKWLLKVFCKALIPYTANYYYSCGTDAGIYYFGKNKWKNQGTLMNNAIDLEAFRFSLPARETLRQEYGLSDKLVVGHVGRFNLQKNHLRLIEIFKEISEREKAAVLVLIGEGELENAVKEKIAELGLNDKVLLLGLRNDVEKWYQAMDVFVMPSLFEGLPVVGIEAQTAGLPCIYSDAVTKEAQILPESKRLSLKLSNGEWAEAVLESGTQKTEREKGCEALQKAGYDIKTEAKRLEDTYKALCKE